VDCEPLFVYGSLRRGFDAQGLMRRLGARYVGKGTVHGRLFDLGQFPGAVKAPGSSAQVAGELYYLPSPARALKSLDRYEGSRYKRELAEVKLQDGRRARAWIYWLKRVPAPQHQIKRGDYAAKLTPRT
jgi:gamma-glutamylcyclotransferase (GGCT)/AIG2-like uncharacterized protein YtfP